MVGEVDVDREAGCRQLAGIEAAVQPPEQQVGVKLFGLRVAECPSGTPCGKAEDDRFEITARRRELVAALIILFDHARSPQLLESSAEQRAGKPWVAADELVEPRCACQQIANDVNR